jgi:crossover junction endodeoxyribonuclease RusA
LSPNARQHWARLAKFKKRYRATCAMEVAVQTSFRNRKALQSLPQQLDLELQFVRPNRRSYDRDNLLARMKAGLDGLCDALHIDDSRFASVRVSVVKNVIAGGAVNVRIKRAERVTSE